MVRTAAPLPVGRRARPARAAAAPGRPRAHASSSSWASTSKALHDSASPIRSRTAPKLGVRRRADLHDAAHRAMLETANAEAERLKDEFVGVEHLLIAIADERDGDAARILREFSVDKERIYRALQEVRGSARVDSPPAESHYQALEKYASTSREAARAGQARPGDRPRGGDPARHADPQPAHEEQPGDHRRGRRRQDRRSSRASRRRSSPATCRRTCGTSACWRSTWARWSPARSSAASSRSGCRRSWTRSSAPRARSSSSSTSCTRSSAPAAPRARSTPRTMMKPALARGELHVIGATTLDEYRKYIEKDTALERRFAPVYVDEPSVEETIEILQGPAAALRGAPQGEDHGRGARGGGAALATATSPSASCPTRRST